MTSTYNFAEAVKETLTEYFSNKLNIYAEIVLKSLKLFKFILSNFLTAIYEKLQAFTTGAGKLLSHLQ